MYGHQTQLDYLKLHQEAIHNEVRHQHLANKTHRANKLKKARVSGKLHARNLLNRIWPQISLGNEEPNPEPKEAHA